MVRPKGSEYRISPLAVSRTPTMVQLPESTTKQFNAKVPYRRQSIRCPAKLDPACPNMRASRAFAFATSGATNETDADSVGLELASERPHDVSNVSAASVSNPA